MKKRVIGLLLALVLLMSLLPAGAMASGGEGESGLTELWVNGVNMLNDPYTVECGEDGGYASYDKDSNTLTLRDAIITEGHTVYGGAYGIYADGDLNIVLEGTSTAGSDKLDAGVNMDGDLTITGTGSLTTTGDDEAGIDVSGNLTVNGGTVIGNHTDDTGIDVHGNLTVNSGGTVSGTSSTQEGVHASTLTVNGGSVAGSGLQGVCVENSITVESGTLTGTGTGEDSYFIYGIYVKSTDGNFTVSGGSVTGKGTGEDSHGIHINGGSMTVEGGTVTSSGEGYYSSGIYIEDNGSLTVEDGEVTSTGNGENCYGIYMDYLTITGGTVTARANGKNGYGLNTFKDKAVTISKQAKVIVSSETPGNIINLLSSVTIMVDDIEYTPNNDTTELRVENGDVTESTYKPMKQLWIDGKNMSVDENGEVECGESGTASYNAASNTLTLTDAKITNGYEVSGKTYGIYANGDLNIELAGTSTVESDQLEASVYIDGDLTISGTGSLEAKGGNAAGIRVYRNLTVNSGSVTGSSSEGEGIDVSGDLIVNSGSVSGNSGEEEGIDVSDDLIVNSGGIVSGTSSTYIGICCESSIIVNGGTVFGTGTDGIVSFECITVNGGTVSGTGTGTGTGWGVDTYGLTMTGGTVTGKGDNAAIVGFGYDSLGASEIINLPAGYLPEGYELQAVVVEWDDGYSETYAVIAPSGAELVYDENNYTFTGAATEVTLKDWQGENPEQPTTPSEPATPIIPAVPTTPGKDASQQAVDKIESAQGGETVNVDLTTGKTELDKEVFEELSGKDATLEVKVPGGVTWTVNGKDIPAGADLTDLDLSVDMDTGTIPAEAVNSVNSEAGTVQLTVKNDGEFGFTMTLTAPVGAKNAGLWANLYHYDEAAGKLVYTASSLVDGNGYASLPVGSAGQYAIVLDGKSHALPFTDLAAGAWYEDAVAYVYRHDLMSGFSEDTFGPNASLSRAQLCQILYNMEGRPAVTGSGSFSDLADGAWYTDAVTWAASKGIVDGYGGGLFGPDDNITREQLASILYRYAQARGDDVSVGEDTNILSYSDAADVAEYAISAMQWACGAGVIAGISESALAPRGEATRAQTAAMLMRFCEQYVEW